MNPINVKSSEASCSRAAKTMESLSSYTISDISTDQVKDYVELTELAGIPITFELTKIILQMLSSGIEPEVIYHLCLDMRNERKRQRHKKKTDVMT